MRNHRIIIRNVGVLCNSRYLKQTTTFLVIMRWLPGYLKQTTEPAFPGIIDGYGLLTWLNTDMTKPADDKGTARAHCCAPRWASQSQMT